MKGETVALMLFFLSLAARSRSSFMRLLIWVCSVVCAMLVVACNGALPPSTSRNGVTPTTVQSPTVLGELITPGVLTVGSYTNYLPQEYINPATHQTTGFDIELIKAMAQRMNLQTKIVPDDFSALIGNLMSGRYDVVISAVSITKELQVKVDFIPYFKGGESLLVRKGNPKNIKSLADLCGQTVGVRENSFEQDDLNAASKMCRDHGKPAITLIVMQRYIDVINLLQTKHVVATYQDASITDYFVKQDSDSFEEGGAVVSQNTEGIAVRKGNIALLAALERAFNSIKADGTYHFMIERWGLVNGDITRNKSS